MASSPVPFQISVPQESIDILHKKLDLADFPDELEDAGRDYGAPLADVKRLVKHWKSDYQWREHEAQLNKTLPQFKVDLEVNGFGSLGVHFVHQKSEVANAIPLLFVHGWPGHFLEVAKILPLLVKPSSPNEPAFHVVAPSLPGYGFSDAPRKRRFAMAQNAELFNKLMILLGYDQYVTQGGDWGAYVTRKIASVYGHKHSMAWHSNFPQGIEPTLAGSPLLYLSHLVTPYTEREQLGLERTQEFQTTGRGYYFEQATKPQTLGYALADSPVGLLAWIYEKLVAWTDDYQWDDDEVLTWISLYWFSTAGPAASVRLYYEVTKAGDRELPPSEYPTIPHGVSLFPRELRQFPLAWVKACTNLVFHSEHARGGHFAAHEKPEELVSDLRKMLGRGGPAYGVVSGKDGYA